MASLSTTASSLSTLRTFRSANTSRPHVAFSSLRRLQPRRRLLQVSCKAKPETIQTVIEVIKGHTQFEDLGAHSLDQVELVMAREEKFDITLEEEGAEAITTVEEAADLIKKTLAKANA
ncbi:hypothetical protein KP509_01G024100 [Ceratopteris richardii]|uniref:Carrier domain-containing protein n=1 Tax=Ceratopteris richardii TaxID=49495 RepID=A0A8T2VEJ9_CERRI|nr:hypothetical protein KP509_01G024100 [Ceratopteris richardii]